MRAAALHADRGVRLPSIRRVWRALWSRWGGSVKPADESLLAHRLEQDGSLSLREGLSLALDLAGSLSSLESVGAVHLRITPRAIQLSAPGAAQIIPRTSEGGGGNDWFGVGLYDAHYLSPEQMAGDVVVDIRSDVYALGCVLYHAFTGAPPHVAVSSKRLVDVRRRNPALPICTLRPDLPVALGEVIDVALARDPALRHPSAHAMLHALLGVAQTFRRRRARP